MAEGQDIPLEKPKKKYYYYNKGQSLKEFRKGYPWFRIIYVLIAHRTANDEIQYMEYYAVAGSKNDYYVDVFSNELAAKDRTSYLNDWWEKDYRSVMRTKGNALWRSLVE